MSEKVSALQTEVDMNTLSIQDNTALIFDLEEQLDGVSFDDSDVVNLATAYAVNINARRLIFTIEGACYGSFQGISAYLPDLFISGVTGTSIIPNPTTNMVALVADNNEITLTGVDIVAGENDFHIIKAEDNSTLRVSDLTINAVAGNDFAFRIERSSIGA